MTRGKLTLLKLQDDLDEIERVLEPLREMVQAAGPNSHARAIAIAVAKSNALVFAESAARGNAASRRYSDIWEAVAEALAEINIAPEGKKDE